ELANQYRESWGLPRELRTLIGGLDDAGYDALVGRAIVGAHDPDEVVLMEMDPDRQKTRPDSVVTERRLGVRAVDIRSIVQQGRVRFTPVIETPHGPTQVEIRITYIWLDRLTLVLPRLRMGRGTMMSVDHNRNMAWGGRICGAHSVGLLRRSCALEMFSSSLCLHESRPPPRASSPPSRPFRPAGRSARVGGLDTRFRTHDQRSPAAVRRGFLFFRGHVVTLRHLTGACPPSSRTSGAARCSWSGS